MRRVCQNGHARNSRDRLFQNLQAFANQLKCQEGNAGHISSRSCQALDKAGFDRIATKAGNNRHGSGCYLSGSISSSLGDNNINFFSNEFSHKADKPRSVLMTSVLELNVLSLYIAQIAKPIAECSDSAARLALRCYKSD